MMGVRVSLRDGARSSDSCPALPSLRPAATHESSSGPLADTARHVEAADV
jgi:hypothetical protein